MKTLKHTYKLFLVSILLIFTSLSIASENHLNDYYKTIRCLVCDGQSIQESDTEFAINLKQQIKKKYQSGNSLNEINNELINIYGEQISFNPSKNHFLLWGMPLILLLIVFMFIKNRFKFFKK